MCSNLREIARKRISVITMNNVSPPFCEQPKKVVRFADSMVVQGFNICLKTLGTSRTVLTVHGRFDDIKVHSPLFCLVLLVLSCFACLVLSCLACLVLLVMSSLACLVLLVLSCLVLLALSCLVLSCLAFFFYTST